MKTISYQGREIELSAITFFFGREITPHEGVFVHDTADEFGNGDAVYGNGWTLGAIEDESDLESLFASGDGTTYWHKNFDGTYTIDA